MNNVKSVVQKKLCTGCGICKAICPIKCIKIVIDKYGIMSPVVGKECVCCKKCIKVCPGIDFNYPYFMEKIYGEIPENILIGPVIKAYAGYTPNKKVLDISQSGGFVSTLLIYGLKNKLFDGAVVTAWDKKDPFKPLVYIAKTEEEILEAVGSKYNPIPVAAIVDELLQSKGKYVFVGTSCQIQAMRKAEEEIKGLSGKEYMEIQPGDVLKTYADITDLEKPINFKPKTTIKQGIKEFVKWYKEYYGVGVSRIHWFSRSI